jgi:hypothetical protein
MNVNLEVVTIPVSDSKELCSSTATGWAGESTPTSRPAVTFASCK